MLWRRPELGKTHARRILARRDLPCEKCGYNLRGSPGKVCPECGEAVTVEWLRQRLREAAVEQELGSWARRIARALPWIVRAQWTLFAVYAATLVVGVWGGWAGAILLGALGTAMCLFGLRPIWWMRDGVEPGATQLDVSRAKTASICLVLSWLLPWLGLAFVAFATIGI